MGVTTQLTGQTNMGVFSLIILFVIGAVILIKVPAHQPKAPAVPEADVPPGH